MTPDELSDRLMAASVRIGRVVDSLPETRLGRHVAGQLVRCGTSFGPNYEEGSAGESRKDFIHKLKVSLKELRESRYWLVFLIRCELVDDLRLNDLIAECHELILILNKSITTAKQNLQREQTQRKSLPRSSTPLDGPPPQSPIPNS